MVMRSLIVLAALLLPLAATAEEAMLQKAWVTAAELRVPESVRYDAERKVLYVSNIAGTEPWADDGNGSIAKVGLDGTVIDAEWVTGLNGPKGMDIRGEQLLVTDIDDVVTIDIPSGAIVDRVTVPGAMKVNDLSISDDGTVYVTDSGLHRIQAWDGDSFETVVEGLTALNGVLYSQGELLFVADGGLHSVQGDGLYTTIATGMEGRVDGVERVDDDTWLVSCWQGTVYIVRRDGSIRLLLDGRPDETSAADLGYDPVNRVAYFPGFWKNNVAAYRLVTGD